MAHLSLEAVALSGRTFPGTRLTLVPVSGGAMRRCAFQVPALPVATVSRAALGSNAVATRVPQPNWRLQLTAYSASQFQVLGPILRSTGATISAAKPAAAEALFR